MSKREKWPMMLAGAVVLPALMAVLAACVNDAAPAPKLPATVTGKVIGANGPVAGAIVQVQGTQNRATTDDNGVFRLHGEGLGSTAVTTITAWGPEHYINFVALDPAKPSWQVDAQQAATGIELSLKPLFAGDNHKYGWFTFEGKEGSASCGMCHREYPEWQADAHSKTATSHRFVTMYNGTNMQGQKSQPIQYSKEGKILPPDPALPNYGPGFRIDNPERPGNCATCHTPMARKIETTNSCAWSGCHTSLTAERASTQGYELLGASATGLFGIAEEGISCEFCHVVQNVKVDPGTGLPYPDQPGIMSMELRRPPEDHKLFFGTFMDTTREGLSYLPFQSTSQFCAACHYGVLGGVVSNMKVTGGVEVYSSYREWLESPWSDPQTGKTCQDCHMPTKNTPYSVDPDRGGFARPAGAYHDHTMTGPTTSQSLMWNAVTMKSEAQRDGDVLRVNIDITNDKTGHAVPTDAPIRSVMLVVEARDANGNLLAMTEGPVLPEWAGNEAGLPGKGFAKILRDTNTGEAPTAAYWRQVEILEDTRLFPMKTDSSSYEFALPQGTPAKVTVKLIYRPAFQKLAEQKGWADPDIQMAEIVLEP